MQADDPIIQRLVNAGIAVIHDEPEYSHSIIKKYQEKYGISNEDMIDLSFHILVADMCTHPEE